MDGIGFLDGLYLPVLWLVAAILFGVIEAVTLGIATIWFVIGALVAAVASLFGAPFAVQIVLFLGVSVALLVFTRPIAVKKLKIGREKNVTESIEGRVGIVTEAIRPFGSGFAKVGGIVWTAVGETPDAEIVAGSEIVVVRIEGVKIIVRNKPDAAE